MSKPNDHNLSKSKMTTKKNNTYNNEETLDDRSASWSRVNASRSTVFDRLYQDSKMKNARKQMDKSKIYDSQFQNSSKRDLN